MDFELDEQQRMLRDTARDFFRAECDKSVIRKLEASDSGHSAELWKKMADLGWMGMVIPEEYGGVGLGFLDLAVLFEEIGRAAFDSPLFTTTLGMLAILEGGTEAQKSEWLPRAAAGELILTLALAEHEVSADYRFVSLPGRALEGGCELRGTKLFVPYAPLADLILVAARTGGSPGDEQGISLFAVNGKTEGLRSTFLETLAPDKQYRVEFDGVRVPTDSAVGKLNTGFPIIRSVLEKAVALQCVQLVGGAEHEVEVTVEYTKEREQFDRPIGTFQAVQHQLADMFTDVQGSRWTSYQAVSRLSKGLPAARELAIAKAFTGEACNRVAAGAQQLHGGIGFDLQYDIQFYWRRARAIELNFGPAPLHLETLGKELGM